MNKAKSINIPPVPAILLSIISVQGGASIAKGLFPILGAATTALIRVSLSAVILLAFNRTNLRSLTVKQWKAVIPYGLVLGAMNLIFYMALTNIPLGLGVTLEFVGPLTVAVFGSRRAMDIVWIVLAALGIVLIAPWNTKNIDPLGAGMALLAGAFWAAYIVLGSRATKELNGKDAVTVGMLFSTLVILPFGVASGGLHHLSPIILLEGAALALLSSAIPFSLEINALSKIPARTFSILMSLEPAVAALCGLVILHESLSLYEWLAVVFVIIASTGAALTSKSKVRDV